MRCNAGDAGHGTARAERQRRLQPQRCMSSPLHVDPHPEVEGTLQRTFSKGSSNAVVLGITFKHGHLPTDFVSLEPEALATRHQPLLFMLRHKSGAYWSRLDGYLRCNILHMHRVL